MIKKAGFILGSLLLASTTFANSEGVSRTAEVRMTYSAQSNENYDLTVSANEAYSMALQKCQRAAAKGCYIPENATCSHMGMRGGSVVISSGWYCRAEAVGTETQRYTTIVRTAQSQYHEDTLTAINQAEQDAQSSCNRGDLIYAGRNCRKSKETTCQKLESETKSWFGKKVTTVYSCQAEFTGEMRTRP